MIGTIGSVSPACMRDHSKPSNAELNASKQKKIDNALLNVGNNA